MRLAVQLIAVRSRTWIWAERYDLDFAETLSAQDDMIAGIMGAIDAGVRRAQRDAARAKPITDLDAWSLFHRGMWHVYRFSREDVTTAEQHFTAAIEKEPSAAKPRAGLAYASIIRVLWRFTDDPRATLAAGLRHAREALARDEYDPHVHTVLGRLLAMTGQPQRGLEHLDRAIELNPSHAHAHYGRAYALFVVGKPGDALDPLRTATRLSPKDPMASMFLTMAAYCHLMLDDFAAAETCARRANSLLSRLTSSRLALAASLQIKGDEDGARAAMAEARDIDPALSRSTVLPLVQYIPAGMRDRLLAAFASAGLPAS